MLSKRKRILIYISNLLYILIIIFVSQSSVFSQDKNYSLQFSATTYHASSNNSDYVSPLSTISSQKDRKDIGFNIGLNRKIFGRNYIELNIGKFSLSHLYGESFVEGVIDNIHYEKTNIELNIVPSTLSFRQNVINFDDIILFYQLGISYYLINILEDKTDNDVSIYNNNTRNNTMSYNTSCGFLISAINPLSLYVSFGYRFVDDFTLGDSGKKFKTGLDGYILRTGFMIHIF